MKSMTGFGRAVSERGGHSCTVEIRTVNHRFCEITLRLPSQLLEFETSLRRQLADGFPRGAISASITLDGREDPLGLPRLNEPVADRYLKIMRGMKRRQGVGGELDINTLAMLPDFFTWDKSLGRPREVLPLVRDTLAAAIQQVNREREREGKALARDCRRRANRLRTLLGRIGRRGPERARAMKERYLKRITDLATDLAVDSHRLAQELSILADRLDFTEECVRLAAHVEQFIDLMRLDEPMGRRLNFLLQEMGREANTIGSKANDPSISMQVVDLKEEIEKLREQVQNLE